MTRRERGSAGHDEARRSSLKGLLGLASAAAALVVASGARAADKPKEIGQPPKADKQHFMQRALEMRRIAQERGDQAYGAAIVKDGRIVGERPSAVIGNQDPTAHAEMEAIRDVARRLGTRDLSGCEMYGSSKACPMCETAAYWAGISKIYYGPSITDAGPPRYPSC